MLRSIKLVSISLIFSWIIIVTKGQFNSELDIPLNPSYHELNTAKCPRYISPGRTADIRKYKNTAKKIMREVTEGSFKGKIYKDLAIFADTFGPRISGSESLEDSIDYMKEKFIETGLKDIQEQPVTVPKWVRGYEHAEMIQPYEKTMNILGLGTSVGTPPEGITAEVIVVTSMDELKKIGELGQAKGKIVLFNFKITYYSEVTKIVTNAASNASYYGAVAALTKSLTKVSVNSPHTKVQKYAEGVIKIPVAAVTVEDAELIGRLHSQGETIIVQLTMEILENTESTSRNLIGDYKGVKNPESIVLVSGHIDSWDVGEGAQDDGIGIFLALETVRLLKHLSLSSKRTIRAVLWTGEEFGTPSPNVYMEQYKNQLKNHNAVMEADLGCFKPVGFFYSKLPEVGCILHEITRLFPRTNTTVFIPVDESPNDLNFFLKQVNIPTVSLNGNDGRYFWYHHSDGDTMSAVDPNSLDLCLAVWATTAFILADMKEDLPR